jgi:hypothetical protein
LIINITNNAFSKIWIIIIFASFVGGGILIWQYSEIQNTEKTLEDKTANWKTYRNDEYGFEVQYPNDWEKCFSKDERILLRIIPHISDSDIPEGWDPDYFKSPACMYGSVEFDIEQRKDFNLEKLKKYYSALYKDDAECDPEILIKETTFNGYPALEVGSCDLSGMYSGTMITFLHNQTEFRVHVSSNAVRIAGQEIIDEMLSTVSVTFQSEEEIKIGTSEKELETEIEKTQGVYSGERQRDARRKADIRQIVTALDMFYVDIEAYAQIGGTATMPSSIGESLINESIMAEVSKDPVSGENYIWIDNTKNSSKFCIYAKLEQGGYYAGSEKGTKILNFPPKDLSCW